MVSWYFKIKPETAAALISPEMHHYSSTSDILGRFKQALLQGNI